MSTTARARRRAEAHAFRIDRIFPEFETIEDTKREDAKRASSLLKASHAIDQLGLVDPFHARSAVKLGLQIRRARCRGKVPRTMASSGYARKVRKSRLGEILRAFDHILDDDLYTFTVISRDWLFSAVELTATTARLIKRQFLVHLERAGVSKIEGPLVAFLHGEFEPESGKFQLHFHGVTKGEKALALKRLSGKWGYLPTASGGQAVRCSKIKNKVGDVVGGRIRQITYILQGFWPKRAIRIVDGVPKRERRKRRIPEPFHALSLVWMDQQKLGDLTVASGCRFLPNGQLRLR